MPLECDLLFNNNYYYLILFCYVLIVVIYIRKISNYVFLYMIAIII